MSENMLDKESITSLFFKYSIPAVAGMLFLGLNVLLDGFFVGHYIGINALASVNIAMPFSSLMLAIGVIIGIGTQSNIGRMLGEGKHQEAGDAFKTALILITGISFLLLILAVGFTRPIAAFLGASEDLMPMVVSYIGYVGLFLPFFGIMFVLDYVLKVMGKPFYSMLVLIVSVLSHMVLNYLFIVRLGLGIRGAALATGISYVVAFIMAIVPFITGKTRLKLGEGSFKKGLASGIIYNGSPEGLSEIGTGVTTFLFNITLMRYVGEAGVAAFTAISYLSFIGNNILIGLSDGVGAIISYNYGSGKMERVKKAVRLAGFSAIVIGSGLFSIIIMFARELMGIFLEANYDQVLNLAVYGGSLYAGAFLVNGLNIVASGYFTAIGDPLRSAFIALNKGIVWIGIGIVLLPFFFGIKGIWLTVPVAEILTLLLSAAMLFKHFAGMRE